MQVGTLKSSKVETETVDQTTKGAILTYRQCQKGMKPERAA